MKPRIVGHLRWRGRNVIALLADDAVHPALIQILEAVVIAWQQQPNNDNLDE